MNSTMLRRVALLPRRIQWSRFSTQSPTTKEEDDLEEHELEEQLMEFEEMGDPYGVPSSKLCSTAPRKFRQASNTVLSILSAQKNHGARKERLVREIIRVDGVSYIQARQTLAEINKANDSGKQLVTLPYKIGVIAGLAGGLLSIPLVCHKGSAVWFNDNFVHCPEPDDGLDSLENAWLVGEWTWGWMEPCLGTLSFLLLSFQFSRAQMQNLQWKPYTERLLSMRADRLAAAFPQYERQIVRDFSTTDPWNN